MARVLVLDVIYGKGLYEAECSNLKDFYKELDCECFDITRRNVGGRIYDIYCDDIGTFRDDPIPSAFDRNRQPCMVGNLIFSKHDFAGDSVSLTDDDIQHIIGLLHRANVKKRGNGKYPESWCVIFPVDYM